MTGDVLGAYIPGNTLLHRTRPGIKLLTLFLGATLAMVFRSVPSAAIALTLTLTACVIAGMSARRVWRTLLRFAIVAGLLFVLHAVQHSIGEAFAVVGTLVALLLAANVFTATTRVEDTVDTIAWLLRPLRRFRVNPERVGLVFSLVMRMIPEVLSIAHQTRDAARARGVEYSLRARLTPLVVRTVSRAHLTGEALAARGISDDKPDMPGSVEAYTPRQEDPPVSEHQTPADFWEARYASTEKSWSGNVNTVLADIAVDLTPGTALDLGCGEGGDAVWLADHGWKTLGVDLSPTAVERGRAAGRKRGLTEAELRFETGDLATWEATERFDLVTSSFLQSWPVEIPRDAILAKATSFVAPGGYFLVTAHAAAPSWADPEIVHGHQFPTPEDDLAALSLSPGGWDVIVCEIREREITSPTGEIGTLGDSVVFVKRTK